MPLATVAEITNNVSFVNLKNDKSCLIKTQFVKVININVIYFVT